MTETENRNEGLSVTSVALDKATVSRILAVASQMGTTRSHAAGELASAGVAAMLGEAAEGDDALREARATMTDGTSPKLTAGLVETMALPQVSRDLGADIRWLAALPQAQRRDMSARIVRAASSLASDDGTVSWSLVLSTVRVMCRWSRPPWILSDATRAEACQQAEARIASLLPQTQSDDIASETTTELAALSAWRLAAGVSDVPGMSPEGPLALVAALLAPRARGLVDEQTVEIRQDAASRLAALLGITAEEAHAVGASARSALQALELEDVAVVRSAALALAGYAKRLSAHVGGDVVTGSDTKDKASLALSQKGAREIAGYAAAHPRAKLAALEAAGHVSHSTLQRRLVQLEAAGVMRNVGTQVRPLWQVAGVERDPEDELTERQQKVLALMRREPPAKTKEIALEIGTSAATVFATYRELAALGLAEKTTYRWVAVPKEDATEDDAQ